MRAVKITKQLEKAYYYKKPMVHIQEEQLKDEVEIGQVYTGTITVYSENEKPLYVKASSVSSYVVVTRWEEKEGKWLIHYDVLANQLGKPDTLKGAISLITNGGEFSVPYEFYIVEQSVKTSLGPIKDLFQFANLAQVNWQDAVTLFHSAKFPEIFLKDEKDLIPVYELLKESKLRNQSLEEFLVYIHKKVPVTFSLQTPKLKKESEEEQVVMNLIFEKKGWGFQEFFLTSKEDFLILPKERYTTEDFTGSRLEIPVTVNKEGNQWKSTSIKMSTVYETIEIPVIVTGEKQEQRNQKKLERKGYHVELVKNYLKFRKGDILLEQYMNITVELLNKIMKTPGTVLLYQLLRIHMDILAGEEEKVAKGLNNFEAKIEEIDKKSFEYSCFCYLKALHIREEELVKETIQFLSEQDEKGRFLCFQLKMYLEPKFQHNVKAQYEELSQLYDMGMNSPLLYCEVLHLFEQNAELFTTLTPFSLSAMAWGIRNNVCKNQVLYTFQQLMTKEKKLNPLAFSLLHQLYKQEKKEEQLNTLCSLIIKSNHFGSKYQKYAPVLKEGVTRSLKIIGLNEGYLATMDHKAYAPLPHSMLLYFTYENQLKESELGYLYANVIVNKNHDISMYHAYVPKICQYMEEQLKKGVINQDLEIIYQEFLKPDKLLTDLYPYLPNIIFKQKLICKNPNMKAVHVRHSQLEAEEKVYLTNQVAYVNVFTDNPNIVLVDQENNRYISTVEYQLEPVLEVGEFMPICSKYCKDNVMVLLHLYEGKEKYQKRDVELLELGNHLLEKTEVTEEVLQSVILKLIQYHYDNYEGELLEQYLLHVDLNKLSKEYRGTMIDYYIVRKLYVYAYLAVEQYGCYHVSPKKLLALLSYKIEESEYEENPFITREVTQLFLQGRYNQVTVKYLQLYLEGTINQLVELYKASKELKLSTFILAEKIIRQFLITGAYEPKIYEVFNSYLEKEHDKKLVVEFVQQQIYSDFFEQCVIPQEMYEKLEALLLEETPVMEYCKVAYLYYLEPKKTLTASEEKLAIQFIKEWLSKDIYLPVFEKFSKIVALPLEKVCKTYITYVTKPNKKVTVFYTIDSATKGEKLQINHNKEFVQEVMREVVEGVYIKEFIVFHDEELFYYLEEKDNESNRITESDSIKTEPRLHKERENKFDFINFMLMSREMKDDDTLIQLMEQYLVRRHFVDNYFTLQ